jgi:RNA polymerase sigma-70 factor (ECF subfamily)
MDLALPALRACQHGDAAAFRALVELYQDRVYALCVALAGADGEDLAQETFVRVHRSIRAFDPKGAATLGGWILTIARRLCQDRARGARLRVEVPVAVPPPIASSALGPSEALENERLAIALRHAIAQLPEEQRAAIALREWDGLSYEEIAAIEGVPVGTVRSRLGRARETLRALLAESEERHVAER